MSVGVKPKRVGRQRRKPLPKPARVVSSSTTEPLLDLLPDWVLEYLLMCLSARSLLYISGASNRLLQYAGLAVQEVGLPHAVARAHTHVLADLSGVI